MHRATIFLDNHMVLYFIANYILSDNSPHIVSKISPSGYFFFRVWKLTTTANHQQINDPAWLEPCLNTTHLPGVESPNGPKTSQCDSSEPLDNNYRLGNRETYQNHCHAVIQIHTTAEYGLKYAKEATQVFLS